MRISDSVPTARPLCLSMTAKCSGSAVCARRVDVGAHGIQVGGPLDEEIGPVAAVGGLRVGGVQVVGVLAAFTGSSVQYRPSTGGAAAAGGRSIRA
jgi:hypothetical protein